MSTLFPTCQLCGVAPASCKSHIIPKQFYRRIRGTEKNIFELHVEGEVERPFSQNGIWEQGILCPACDNNLGELDGYAYKTLPENIQESQIRHFPLGLNVYELGVINSEKFRKFLVALIWRASRAKHEMFKFMDMALMRNGLRTFLLEKTFHG